MKRVIDTQGIDLKLWITQRGYRVEITSPSAKPVQVALKGCGLTFDAHCWCPEDKAYCSECAP